MRSLPPRDSRVILVSKLRDKTLFKSYDFSLCLCVRKCMVAF